MNSCTQKFPAHVVLMERVMRSPVVIFRQWCLRSRPSWLIAALIGLGWTSIVGAAPALVKIDDPTVYRSVYVVTDVHGAYGHLLRLLVTAKLVDPVPVATSPSKVRWSGGSSLLIVTGDSIDKGDDSLEVIDLWIALQEQAFAQKGRVIHLLGNHEQTFLADPWNSKAKEFRKELKRKGVELEELINPNSKRGKFLRELPLIAAVSKWLFFHSGFMPLAEWPVFLREAQAALDRGKFDDPFFTNDESPLEARDWWKKEKKVRKAVSRLKAAGFFGIAFGHQNGAFGFRNRIAATAEGHLIKVDSGLGEATDAVAGEMLQFDQPQQLTLLSFPRALAIRPTGDPRVINIEEPQFK